MFFLPENTSLNTVVIRGERPARLVPVRRIRTSPTRVVRAAGVGARPRRGRLRPAYTRPRSIGRPTATTRRAAVSVKFLSTEWAEAVKAAAERERGVPAGGGSSQQATIQQIISSSEGETHYWIVIADGAIDMGVGDADGPDATITQSYETAVKLAKSELSVGDRLHDGQGQGRRKHGPADGPAGRARRSFPPRCRRSRPTTDRQDRRRSGRRDRDGRLRPGDHDRLRVGHVGLGERDATTELDDPAGRDESAPRCAGARYCTSSVHGRVGVRPDRAPRPGRRVPAAVSASVASTPPCTVPCRFACSGRASSRSTTAPSSTASTEMPIDAWNGR